MEPWLNGSISGFDPVVSHLLRGSEHIREDAAKWLAGKDPWASSAGFHARHLAGSTERLTTYLRGLALSDAQLLETKQEHERVDDLAARISTAFDLYDATVRALRPEEYGELRYVGRRRIPVTAVSLAIHIIEHGQRHLGQMIEALKCSQ